FDRFRERMHEEASSVVGALERNVRSMVDEIDASWDKALEKLASSKNEFEQTIDHTVEACQLNVSQDAKGILNGQLLPRLKERKEALRNLNNDLTKRFTEESMGRARGQVLGLEASLSTARQQLQQLVEECMASIDQVGRGQQAGLEEIFKDTSTHVERSTSEVIIMLQNTEK